MKRTLSLFFLLLAAGTLPAQTESQFSLTQAIDYALKNHLAGNSFTEE